MFVIYRLFDDRCDRCEVASHCGFLKKYLSIYFAVLGLSCGWWAMLPHGGILVWSDQGSNPHSLCWRWILIHWTTWKVPRCHFYLHFFNDWASQVVQWVKNLPAMQEAMKTWVRSLGWEDPLEEGMTTQSSILAWRIPLTEEPGGLQSVGLQRAGYDWVTKHTYTPTISGVEHPMSLFTSFMRYN